MRFGGIKMKYLSKVEVLGDSILKGIQVNKENLKYYIKNDFGIDILRKRYEIDIQNNSKFGCTVTKGDQMLTKKMKLGLSCDAVVMDFGGNDCDYKWSEIAANPYKEFKTNTPIDEFRETYRGIIKKLRDNNIIPILTTLPPLEAQHFFDWWCKDLNKENIMKWLGNVATIYNHQEHYSKEVEKIAKEENVPIVDIRSAFLSHGNVGELLCEDGTHPNSLGQKIITEAFDNFLIQWQKYEAGARSYPAGVAI